MGFRSGQAWGLGVATRHALRSEWPFITGQGMGARSGQAWGLGVCAWCGSGAIRVQGSGIRPPQPPSLNLLPPLLPPPLPFLPPPEPRPGVRPAPR